VHHPNYFQHCKRHHIEVQQSEPLYIYDKVKLKVESGSSNFYFKAELATTRWPLDLYLVTTFELTLLVSTQLESSMGSSN
jgi:hypothetical protein